MTRVINTGNALGAKVLFEAALQENTLPYTDAAGGLTVTASGVTIQLTSPGPAALTGSSGTPILTTSATPVTATGFTLAVMARVPSSIGFDVCFMGVTLGDTDYWEVGALSGSSTIRARVRSGGTVADATIASSLTTNTWHNLAGVFATATDTKVYYDGTLSSAATTSVVPSGAMRVVSIGALQRDGSVAESNFDQFVKYATIFTGALTDAELDSFFADPEQIYLSAATATTLSGPSSGTTGVASTNFTVGANGTITGTVTVTPGDAANGGTFTPTTVAISSGTPTATFTYTPASTGVKTISISDDGGLTDATSISYTSNAGGGSVRTPAFYQTFIAGR